MSARPVRVKIYGAGSIGNHLAHAARQLGWEVVVCDIDSAALRRMEREIYPARYGAWDPAIRLCLNAQAPAGGFDLIAIGTPPESHIPLALRTLEEHPRAILIEKPLCPPSLAQGQELWDRARDSRTGIFVGYDHVVGRAAQDAAALLADGAIGDIVTIDVEFREHWGGIFEAHHWLRGPSDTYLGSWEAGGGAGGEHSHAMNFWQFLAHVTGAGRVIEVDAMVRYVREGTARYDTLCALHVRTEEGLVGRVLQDVVTLPPRKRAIAQGTGGAIEWLNGYRQGADAVILRRSGAPEEVRLVPKTRPDDFIEELRHVERAWRIGAIDSPIRLERGLETMLVLAAAHRAEAEQGRVRIEHDRGYTPEALRPCRAGEVPAAQADVGEQIARASSLHRRQG